MQEAKKHLDESTKVLQKRAAANRSLTRHRTLLQYTLGQIRKAALYTEFQRLLAYLRRVRMIAFLLRVFSLVFTLVETGALVLLTTVLFLILLPIGLAAMLLLLLTALFQSQHTNRKLQAELTGRTVYVFFVFPDAPSSFIWQNALDCVKRTDCACILVSPYWISAKGGTKKDFFCTARKEAAHLYTVRRYYFFSLKRNVLKKEKTVYIF